MQTLFWGGKGEGSIPLKKNINGIVVSRRQKNPYTVFFIWKFEINILEDDIMNNCLKFLNLGRNHHYWSTWRNWKPSFIGDPHKCLVGDPILSLGTPDFHWRPQIFVRYPIFSLETPRFSLETQCFRWRPPLFFKIWGSPTRRPWSLK